MTDLREAAQQALEAWQTATYGHPSHHKATLLAMTALRAALVQQDEPQTLDESMRLPRAMAQAYENGYNAGVAHEREACERACKHQPHWVACVAAIRARGEQP